LDSLRNYQWGTFRADLLAGFSVAAVAVPQAMAYALIVGLPAEYGLYTAIVMTTVGALLDSSRQLINGPTNAISIALLSAVGAAGSPEEKIQLAVLMSFLIGLFQISITLLRLGDLTRYISHSVIVGFTAGASLLLVLDQMKNLLGLKSMGDVHDHFLHRFYQTMTEGGEVHHLTLWIGLAAMAMVLGLRWIKTRVGWGLFPELLVVVGVMAALSMYFDFQGQGVKVIGPIPANLPQFSLPNFSAVQLSEYASSAFAIALLGLLEAISMAKAIAAVTRQKLDMNQQCFSEGMANLMGSFFQCMPGSGSLTRSAINQQAGAQTQWSGVVSALSVAVIMMVFAPYAQFIPRSALAGILILTAARMVNLHDLRYHIRVSRFDAVIVASTAIAAFAISIEFCVLIGVFMSFLLAVPRAGQMLLTEFIITPNHQIHERLPEDNVCGHLLIYGLEGEMFFGSSISLDTHLDTIEARAQKGAVVVLRLKRARNPDAVGLALLEGFLDRMKAKGVTMLLCGVRPEMYTGFKQGGLLKKIDPAHIFLEQAVRQTSTLQAIDYAYQQIQRCPDCPPAFEGERKLYFAQ